MTGQIFKMERKDTKMPVLDTAKARSSVRAYTGQAVEEEKLQKILVSAVQIKNKRKIWIG